MAGGHVIFDSQLASGSFLTLKGLAMRSVQATQHSLLGSYVWKGILPKKQAERSLPELTASFMVSGTSVILKLKSGIVPEVSLLIIFTHLFVDFQKVPF